MSCEDAAVIIQRCYRNWKCDNPPAPKTRASKAVKKQKAPSPPGNLQKVPNEKVELTSFARNVCFVFGFNKFQTTNNKRYFFILFLRFT